MQIRSNLTETILNKIGRSKIGKPSQSLSRKTEIPIKFDLGKTFAEIRPISSQTYLKITKDWQHGKSVEIRPNLTKTTLNQIS